MAGGGASRRGISSTRSALGDIFASIKKLTSAPAEPQTEQQQALPALPFSNNAPDWDALKSALHAKQAALGIPASPDLEAGPTSAHALKRTFGSSDPIRVHFMRDSAAWCPYCHTIWLQLEEKRIPYTVEKINMRCYGDKPAHFLQMAPSGTLPVLQLDGRVFTDSASIAAALEAAFPQRPLLPAPDSPEPPRAAALLRLERRLFSAWMSWLTSGWGDVGNRATFQQALDEVERQLGETEGPFFLEDPERISQVDIKFSPFLDRMVASLAYYKGFIMRGEGTYPALERWFKGMEARDTYTGIRGDFFTHAHDLPPQLGGCAFNDAGYAVAAAIDGLDGSSWRLPLEPLTATSLEPYSQGDDPPRDALEAASRLIHNHEHVVRFAARGAGEPGARPVSAPLSDPTAVPGDCLTEVDAALRHVAHALLEGVEAKQASSEGALATGEGDAHVAGTAVVPSAEYLRDRVGVPRDMSFPAARQLRAHLNWLLEGLTASTPAS